MPEILFRRLEAVETRFVLWVRVLCLILFKGETRARLLLFYPFSALIIHSCLNPPGFQ